MGPLDLSVQLRCAALDVSKKDALVIDVPLELDLELMAAVYSDLSDTERELFDDVNEEVDRVCLYMFVVNFERPATRSVVNRSILEQSFFLNALAKEV